jgi:hypothetical protein
MLPSYTSLVLETKKENRRAKEKKEVALEVL